MLLWIDGFEGYGTVDDAIPEPTSILRRKYTEYRDGSNSTYTQVKAGRLTGHSIWFNNDFIKIPTTTTDDTIIVGFAFKLGSMTNTILFELESNSYGTTKTLNVNVIGTELNIKRYSTTLGTTAGLGLAVDTWYWLELKVVCSATGSYELRIGEADVLSATGVDTRADSSITYYDIVQLGISSTTSYYFDDFYVCDSTGSTNNDFLGNCFVTAIRPNASGNYDDLTASAGFNYQCTDEEIIDNDTSYVEGTSGKDTYNYENVSGMDNILGIQINTQCRETDAQSFNLKTVTRIASTDYTDSEQIIGSTDYVNKKQIQETNPATSVSWTVDNINSAEFGMEVI